MGKDYIFVGEDELFIKNRTCKDYIFGRDYRFREHLSFFRDIELLLIDQILFNCMQLSVPFDMYLNSYIFLGFLFTGTCVWYRDSFL